LVSSWHPTIAASGTSHESMAYEVLDELPVPGWSALRAIAASAVVNFAVAGVWYGVLFSDRWQQHMCRDKSIRPADFNRAAAHFPASEPTRFAVSLACHLVRACILWVVLLLTRVESAIMAVGVAVALFAGSQVPSVHHHFWEGRPFGLIALTMANELTACLLNAVVLVTLM